MNIQKAACPHCAQLLRVPKEFAGQRLKCPKCRKAFQLPPMREAETPQSLHDTVLDVNENPGESGKHGNGSWVPLLAFWGVVVVGGILVWIRMPVETTVVGTAEASLYPGNEPPQVYGTIKIDGTSSLAFAEPPTNRDTLGTFRVVDFQPDQSNSGRAIGKGSLIRLLRGGQMVIVAGNIHCKYSVTPAEFLSAGEQVNIIQRFDDWLEVRTKTGKTGWIRRADLCTGTEYERRVTKSLVPRSITEIRINDGLPVLCGGPVAVRREQTVVEEGQAFWINAGDEDAHIVLAGTRVAPSDETIWYVGPSGMLVELFTLP